MPEDIIIRNCSPTLARLKTASMFTYRHASREELISSLRALNLVLVKKGLRAIPLRIGEGSSLIYVYRVAHLRRDLANVDASGILHSLGYGDAEAEVQIGHLIKRIRNGGSFPHEVGLFLGYPPKDVLGFIEGKDDECKLVGVWKVYSDEEAARAKFALYKRASEVYMRHHKSGKHLEQLTVG